jgi:tRNA A-37 threonylcarbamoyl transferase component Bud32
MHGEPAGGPAGPEESKMSTEPEDATGHAFTELTTDRRGPDIGRDATLVAAEAMADDPALPRFEGDGSPPACGRYRVLGILGSGGMGRVYEAVDDRLDRRVAVKVLHQHLNERHRRRLVREAQALAKLSHPNVVHVYEVEEADGETFVAMELVRGKTLREWAQRDPRPAWRACVEVYLQAGAGLAAAHAEGLVHRDFKPGNAIIDDKGRVRVLDFGLARPASEREPMEAPAELEILDRGGVEDVVSDVRLTTTGTVLGTPAYMPLEQMEGREVDARSDQFSFCVSLYEAVYGELPFKGGMAALMLWMRTGQARPAPKQTAVPAALRRVLLRGLATDPALRWPSMEALLVELQRRVAPSARRWLVVGLAAGFVAVGLGVGYVGHSRSEAAAISESDLQAEVLYEEGLYAYREGLYDETVAKWSKAYALSERPILLYNLSMALERRYEVSRDVKDLLRARSVMKNFVLLAEADPDMGLEDAKERIAKLDADIAATTAAGAPGEADGSR